MWPAPSTSWALPMMGAGELGPASSDQCQEVSQRVQGVVRVHVVHTDLVTGRGWHHAGEVSAFPGAWPHWSISHRVSASPFPAQQRGSPTARSTLISSSGSPRRILLAD